jgi:tellurite methyltransferase
MKNKVLIKYWNQVYKNGLIKKESSFARFTLRKIKKKYGNFLDIGCGNGRDSFFFNKNGFNVTGIDISEKAIQQNSKNKFNNIYFKKFDINRNKIQDKYDVIYCRFFLHAIDENSEDKLINLIKDAKKKQTLVFFEFRNNKDKIFKKFKKKMNTNLYEFEKGHFRRIIDPKAFQKKFLFKTKSKIIYEKSGKNFSIIKNDNPNLSRMIFKF